MSRIGRKPNGARPTVAVLYGGISAEREVSLSSGRQVVAALRDAGYEVRPIEVTDDLPALVAALTPRPDAVFNALHGRFGEDGAIQGVLDWLAIPYTHSGVRASALAMDKEAAKAVFAAAGLPVAPGRVIEIADLVAADPLPRPYVIKPLNEGSSVGVHIVREGDNRRADIARAWSYGPTAMAEEYIPGRELTVAVMEDRALAVTEIVASHTFYDYEFEIRRWRLLSCGSRRDRPGRVPAGARPRAGGAPRARLPRRDARRFPLRRHPGRAGAARAAGSEHPARPDADLAAAGAGGASGHEFLRAVRLDGGARRMSRVSPTGRNGARKAPRNSVKDRPSRWRMWSRRARRMVRPAAWCGAALLVVGFGFALVHAAAPGGTLSTMRERLGNATGVAGLRVRNIVIEGRANTPEPLLRAAIGASRGDAILGFSVEQARARIEQLTWVERATVERRLPDTLVIQLDERRPFAIWQNQGKFVLIDRAGQIVANQDVAQFRSLPLVVGLGAPAAAAPLLDTLTARPGIGARVSAAVRVAERRWNLHLKSGTDVLLPEGAEQAALERLEKLQNEQALLDRPLAVIDMRLADKLVVRPMAADGRSDADAAPLPTRDGTVSRPDPAHADPIRADPGRATGPKRPT